MSRKQRKYEKEIRARRAAEEKIAAEDAAKAKKEKERKQAQEAERKRRAALTPEQRAAEDKRNAIGCGVIFLLLLIVGSCTVLGDDDKNSNTATSQTTSSSQTTTESSTAETAEIDAQNANGGPEQWLKEMFFVEDSWSELLLKDPTMWAGYINGTELDGSNWHVRLQVDRDQDEELAKKAAHAIANLIAADSDPRVKDIDWVIVEDGAGVVIAQESVKR